MKKCSFLFDWDVHYGNIFLYDLKSLTTSLTCRDNPQAVYSPEKNMYNLKNFSSSGISRESYVIYFPKDCIIKTVVCCLRKRKDEKKTVKKNIKRHISK